MIKNFIVPIDFSPESLKGLDIPVLFSQYGEVSVQMVYVMKKSTDYKSPKDDEYKYAQKNFDKIIGLHQSRLGNNSELKYIIKQGKIYAEVVSQAHSYADSIIATSTHGASGFEELFIGSNSFRIITSTTRPVITIRKGNVPDSVKKIVLPINPISESRQNVPFTTDLARFFNSEIHVITVCSQNDRKTNERLINYAQQVKSYLDERNVPNVVANLTGDNLSDLTVNYAYNEKAELISILANKEASLNLVAGSYCHQIINKADIMVLNLSPKDLRRAGSFHTTGG